MRIFSYNISWESMSGAKPEWPLCSNRTDSSHPRHNSVCVSNISQVIEENPADFVLLQEATDFKNLITPTSPLARMKYEVHNSGKDEMVTFWNKKYSKIACLKGQFETGRPWMAILFSNGLCLINIHMGHYTNTEELAMLDKMVKKIKKQLAHTHTSTHTHTHKITTSILSAHKQNTQKTSNLTRRKTLHTRGMTSKSLKSHTPRRFIIGGDFNNDIKKLSSSECQLVLGSVEFYHHPKKILTCCVKRNTHYDHVIDSKRAPLDIIIPYVHHMASDHKPILVTLS